MTFLILSLGKPGRSSCGDHHRRARCVERSVHYGRGHQRAGSRWSSTRSFHRGHVVRRIVFHYAGIPAWPCGAGSRCAQWPGEAPRPKPSERYGCTLSNEEPADRARAQDQLSSNSSRRSILAWSVTGCDPSGPRVVLRRSIAFTFLRPVGESVVKPPGPVWPRYFRLRPRHGIGCCFL